MSEKDNDKHVFSYMDGIPVKISEKYKPPRRVVLPVGFQNRLLQPPVSADYDFDLEEQILIKLQQWREVKTKEKEKRKERIDAENAKLKQAEVMEKGLEKNIQDQSTEDEISPASRSTPTPPFASTAPGPTPQPVTPPSISVECAPASREINPILRPIPIKHHVVSSQINNNKPLSAFNLSDFEADTSSPFDNMELKTINDLEELAQVLQPSVFSQPSEYYPTTMPSGHYAATVHHHIVNQNQSFNPSSTVKMLNDSKSLVNYQPQLNGLTSNYSVFNSMTSSALQMVDSYPSNISANNYQSHLVPTSSCEQSVPHNYVVDRQQVTQSTSLPFDYNAQEPQRKVQHIHHKNIWPSSETFRVTGKESSTQKFSLNAPVELSSSSTVGCTSQPSSPDKSGDKTPSSESAVGAVAQELSQLLKLKSSRPVKLNNQSPSEEKLPHPTPVPTLPDPIKSLQQEDQLLAQKLLEMGFPCARVARAFKALGSSEKVLESLLSLQSLLDAGYLEDRAEHALLLSDNDVCAATRFLKAERQLLDLGFPTDQVDEALVKFNCDRDKALDFLLS